MDEKCTAELGTLNREFGISPRFGFFDDAASPNAFAVQGKAGDGTVMFGTRLAAELLGMHSSGLPLVAVMAHEWAHLLQYQMAWVEEWSVRFELHADYLAGCYLASTLDSNDLPTRLEVVTKMFEGLRDVGYTDPDHHGTPTQRSWSMQIGANIFALPDGSKLDYYKDRTLPDAAPGTRRGTVRDAFRSGFNAIR